MPIEEDLLERSPSIAMMVPYWDKVTALLNGYEAVKAAGTVFLPPFPNESPEDYELRLNTTKLTNVFRDVTDGLATKPFQDEITLIKGDSSVEVPEFVLNWVEDVDGRGNNLTTFAAQTFASAIDYGIDWIFVDYPEVREKNLTISEVKQKGYKPYWVHVLGKNVLDVRTELRGSKEYIVYFRYQEPAYMGAPTYVREYIYNKNLNVVEWFLYRQNDDFTEEERFIEVSRGILEKDYIPAVPLVLGKRDGNGWYVNPPMQDVVDLQITLYKNESALEYIKMLACYPMLATNGAKPSKGAEKISVGPNRVLYGIMQQNGAGGDWHYVEPNANSLEFLQKNIDKTKQDLRELGRQPLTALSSQLTTVTTSVAAGKAKSTVTAWVYLLKDCLENALKITTEWLGSDYEPQVNIYTGFDNVTDDGRDLGVLDSARDRGDISQETYLAELKRRKILSPEFSFEEEKGKLLDEIPAEDNFEKQTEIEEGI